VTHQDRLVKMPVQAFGPRETSFPHQGQQMVSADRIVLGPHDVRDKLLGGPVIDYEVHCQIVESIHEIPNLENDVPFLAFFPDAIWLD
jgi:hypothetical protein